MSPETRPACAQSRPDTGHASFRGMIGGMSSRLRAEGWRALEVFGLSGLAVAQPLYEVFGASPEVFVFADATNRDIVTFALVLLFVPPLVLWGVGAVVGLVAPPARQPVHLVTLGLLTGLLAMYVVKHLGGSPGLWLVAIGLGAGALLVLAYRRRAEATATLLHYLAIGPVLFVISFLVLSPAGQLLRPSGAEAAAIDVARPEALPPVVMIVFDEWPLTSIVDTNGEIDADLYPNLAALAGDATWYPNTTTVTNSTLFAVPSVLTGQMPDEDLSADARSHPQNLFTLLGSVYDLQAVEPVTRLCPTAICNEPRAPRSRGGGASTREAWRDSSLGSLVDDAASVYRMLVSPSEELGGSTDLEDAESELAAEGAIESGSQVDEQVRDARNDQGQVDVFAIFGPRPEGLSGLLHTFSPNEAPTLHFLHLLVPHTPYAHLPSGEHYTPDEGLREVAEVQGDDPAGNVRGPAQQPADFDRHRMLLQAGYVDTLVGDLVHRLRQDDLYKDAMVVITADHGITFEAGAPARGLGPEPVDPSTMPDMAWVPLIIKAPGQTEGRVDDRNAQTIDVLPTMADLLGIDIPWAVDGRSLAGTPRQSDHKPFVRAVGISGASYHFEDPIGIEDQATLDDVFASGVDTFLPRHTGTGRWYSFGPRPDLVGRSVDDFPQGSVSDLGPGQVETGQTVEVAEGEDLPSLVVGRVNGNPPDGTLVAVTVDDTIAAVVPLYTDQFAPGRVAAMALRSTLTPGRHQIGYYVVGPNERPTLRPIALG